MRDSNPLLMVVGLRPISNEKYLTKTETQKIKYQFDKHFQKNDKFICIAGLPFIRHLHGESLFLARNLPYSGATIFDLHINLPSSFWCNCRWRKKTYRPNWISVRICRSNHRNYESHHSDNYCQDAC